MLWYTGRVALAGTLLPYSSFAAEEESTQSFGALAGEPVASKYGEKVLADGGNAIDAAVTAALAACITSPSKCGVGGYGGHAIIAFGGGKKITAIDFNAMAPAAAREDMFPLDAKGKVKNNLNVHGWLAAAVPGTMAGLELALNRYGTRSFRQVLAPAIYLCKEGVHAPVFKGRDDASVNDASPDSIGAAKGAKQRNLPLAKLLETMAERNSCDSFYRGDIAQKIAAAFKANGGLVTFEDMAAYQARELEPLKMKWNGFEVFVSPPTSPGASILEAMSILKALQWEKLSPEERFHAKLEALRLSWADRSKYFGDPEQVNVPIEKLLSSNYAKSMAEQVRTSLKEQRPIAVETVEGSDAGTINISAVDRHGNMMAITLTHGSTFGARVAVKDYGMVLGHGMWRFDPVPGRANSPGPRKRAITNMTPSIVTRGGRAVLAVGGAGGTRIPNSVYEVLVNYVGLKASMKASLQSPRLQTTGTLKVELEKHHTIDDEASLKKMGYQVSRGTTAYVSAASYDSKTGKCAALERGP